jgi:hypothetical protein
MAETTGFLGFGYSFALHGEINSDAIVGDCSWRVILPLPGQLELERI